MSKTELADNLAFVSAMWMLEQIMAQGHLTPDEAECTRKELERKLRPTLKLA